MIAIPNMEKPKECVECFYGLRCKAVPRWLTADFTISSDCPLIEIVQCKDCIYNSDNTDGDTRGWCYKHGIDIIGFCSEGER